MNITIRRRRNKWRTPLIITGIIAALAMLVGLTVSAQISYQTAQVNLIISHDQQVTFLSASRLKSELEKYSLTLETLAQSMNTQALLDTGKGGTAISLKSTNVELSDFDGGVVYLDKFGHVVNTEPLSMDLIGQDWSGRDFFIRLLGQKKTQYSNAVFDSPDSQKSVVVSTPVLDEDNQFIGVFAGIFLLDQKTISPFYASIVRLRLGQDGNVLLIDQNGIILFSSVSGQVGTKYSDRVKGIQLGSTPGAGRAVDADQRDLVVSYAPVPGTPWTLVSEEEWSVLSGEVFRYGRALVGLIILGILIPTAGLGYLQMLRSREALTLSREEQDLRAVMTIKKAVLPGAVPFLPGWSLKVKHLAGQSIVGDFYDYLYLPDGNFMVFLISGYGIGLEGVAVLSGLRASFRSSAVQGLPPSEILTRANNLAAPDVKPPATWEAAVANFDIRRCRIDIASTGGISVYTLIHRDINEVDLPSKPFGAALDTRFPSKTYFLEPVDKVLFCSPGAVNLPYKNGTSLGRQCLLELLCQPETGGFANLDDLTDTLLAQVGLKTQPELDITFIMLEAAIQGQP